MQSNQSNQSNPVNHISEKTIVVMHKPEEYADFKQEQLRQRALGKLTKEERKILGLT